MARPSTRRSLASAFTLVASLLLMSCASSPAPSSGAPVEVASGEDAAPAAPTAMAYEVDVDLAAIEELQRVAVALGPAASRVEVVPGEGALVVRGLELDDAREGLSEVDGLVVRPVEGGLRIEFDDARLAGLGDETVDATVRALKGRLDALGLRAVGVRRDGARRIEVAVPISDPEARASLRRAIEERGLVTVRLPAAVDLTPYADEFNEVRLRPFPHAHLEHPQRSTLREALAPLLSGETLLAYRFRPVYLDTTSRAIVDRENSRWEVYAVQGTPLLTAQEIREVRVELTHSDQEPRVSVVLDERGREVLEAFRRGERQGPLVLMVDDQVLAVAAFGSTASASPDGFLLTTMPGETTADRVTAAESLAAQLRRGALPAPLIPLSDASAEPVAEATP